MTDNPYRPPDAVLKETAPALAGGSYDVGRCLADGWTLTWASFPTWVGVTLAFGVLSLVSTLLVVGLFLVVPVLVWGVTLFYLNVIDRCERFADLFEGFSIYTTALIAMIAAYICYFLVSFLGESVHLLGQATGSDALWFLGAAAQLAWSLFVLPRLYFAPFFIVDQDMSALGALQMSWNVTSDQKLKTAALALLTPLIVLAGVLCLGVGIIPAMNVCGLAWASAYRQMVGTPEERERAAVLG